MEDALPAGQARLQNLARLDLNSGHLITTFFTHAVATENGSPTRRALYHIETTLVSANYGRTRERDMSRLQHPSIFHKALGT